MPPDASWHPVCFPHEAKDAWHLADLDQRRQLLSAARDGSLGAVVTLWEVYGVRLPLVEARWWPEGLGEAIRRAQA